MTEINNNDNNASNPTEKKKRLWFTFFNKWFYMGVFTILACIILDLVVSSSVREILFYKVSINFFTTLGIALILGAIFDFTKNTEAFTEFVSHLLSDIVVSRTFLTRLAQEDKKEALKLILQPTDNQIEQYSNLNEYFIKKLDSAMKIFDTNFKSNLVMDIDVKYDKEKQIVISTGILSHRIYKVRDKYQPIITTFERDSSNVRDTKILYQNGIIDIDNNSLTRENENMAGIDYKIFKFEIPEHLHDYQHLTIQKKIYEPGFDHWTSFHWTSLTPCDGINFSLKCHGDLRVKEHILFDKKDYYHVDVSSDSKSIRITSTEWLDAFTGFTITIVSEPIRNEVKGEGIKFEVDNPLLEEDSPAIEEEPVTATEGA